MRARLLLLAAALAAFGGSLFAGFHFDDYAIFSDPILRPIRWPHPLTQFTFWLNYRIGGQEPLGYHAFNLGLHLAAVLLAYECLRRLLPATAAIVAAAIFAVHPLQAEAVDCVAARGVVLAALLCFAALLTRIEGQSWIALAAFGTALLADERCALFPVILLAMRYKAHGGGPVEEGLAESDEATAPSRSRLGKWLPFYMQLLSRARKQAVCSSSASPAKAYPTASESFTSCLADNGALILMFALAIAAVSRAHIASYGLALVSLRFLRLFVVPWGFTADPDVREPLWLAIAAIILIGATAVWRWRKRISVESETTWMVVVLVLLIPSFSANPATDPRMYLPMFAFAAAAGLLLARIPTRLVAVGLVIFLAAVSVSRTYVWMSEERLWREAVRRAPDKVEPKIQLAKSLRAAEALELLNRARQQAPYNPEIPAEIGKVLLDERQFDGAVDELSRAVALNPKNALAFNNRGVALAALGQSTAAAMDFEHALVLDPGLAEAQENLKRLGVR